MFHFPSLKAIGPFQDFPEFFYWNFCQIFFFLLTVATMFDGGSGHQA